MSLGQSNSNGGAIKTIADTIDKGNKLLKNLHKLVRLLVRPGVQQTLFSTAKMGFLFVTIYIVFEQRAEIVREGISTLLLVLIFVAGLIVSIWALNRSGHPLVRSGR